MVTLSTTKPKVNDPNSLRDLPRWVAWCEETRERKDGSSIKTKIPYDPNSRFRAQSDDPTTWGTRTQAQRRWAQLKNSGRRRGGVGLVLGNLGDGTHLLGLDLDSCLKPTDDEQLDFKTYANSILDRFKTYSEVSPSGKGAKSFFLVKSEDMPAVRKLLDDKTRKAFTAGQHREIALDRARYYAVTNNAIAGLDRFRVVGVEDIRWLIKDAGPAFCAKYGGGDGSTKKPRDESGSGYGYRFMGDCKARGLGLEAAWSAILEDQTEAGEWARRTETRELQRAYDNSKPIRLKNQTPTESRLLVSRPVDQFKRRAIEWLWHPFIPRGMLTQIFGDGEVGKSTMALDLVARITRGARWPRFDIQAKTGRAPKGSVIILCKEDDIARIIRPRLEAAGADLSKVHILGYEVPDDAEEFDPLDRLDTTAKDLERLIREIGDVVAILIDPITDYVGDIDMYKDNQVRALLNPIARMCARNNVAVLFILHLNKKTDQAARHRGMGSMAFRNVSKSTLLVAHAPDRHGMRLMAQEKKNLTPEKWTVAFNLRPVAGNPYPKVIWESDVQDGDVDDLLNKPNKQQRARRLLGEWLKDGSRSANAIRDLAQSSEISEATLKLAKEKVGVVSRKGKKGWIWALPDRELE
jgi:hypothetical protein